MNNIRLFASFLLNLIVIYPLKAIPLELLQFELSPQNILVKADDEGTSTQVIDYFIPQETKEQLPTKLLGQFRKIDPYSPDIQVTTNDQQLYFIKLFQHSVIDDECEINLVYDSRSMTAPIKRVVRVFIENNNLVARIDDKICDIKRSFDAYIDKAIGKTAQSALLELNDLTTSVELTVA